MDREELLARIESIADLAMSIYDELTTLREEMEDDES